MKIITHWNCVCKQFFKIKITLKDFLDTILTVISFIYFIFLDTLLMNKNIIYGSNYCHEKRNP